MAGIAALIKGVLGGKPRSIARAISLVENSEDDAQDLMRGLFPHCGECLILGITGAPGSGKSTLVDQLIAHLRRRGRKIGIIAVDPSSPFTGGAILGDRIRMMRHSTDPEVFIRSMATRGHLGGLAKSTGEAISIFEASGKDIVLVETVGVGQDEVEVVKLADLIVVILTPGAGDDIQVFKAGIMEIADIFVLNKADTPGTGKIEIQLKAMLELGIKDKALPPVIKTVATEGKGTEELVEAVLKLKTKKTGADLALRRKKLIAWMLKDITQDKLYGLVGRVLKDVEFADYVERIYRRKIDPYTAADEIVARLEAKSPKLRK